MTNGEKMKMYKRIEEKVGVRFHEGGLGELLGGEHLRKFLRVFYVPHPRMTNFLKSFYNGLDLEHVRKKFGLKSIEQTTGYVQSIDSSACTGGVTLTKGDQTQKIRYWQILGHMDASQKIFDKSQHDIYVLKHYEKELHDLTGSFCYAQEDLLKVFLQSAEQEIRQSFEKDMVERRENFEKDFEKWVRLGYEIVGGKKK